MRTDGEKWQMHHLLMEDEVEADEVEEDIHSSIPTPANDVAEGLKRHHFSKRLVEKCQDIEDQLLHKTPQNYE